MDIATFLGILSAFGLVALAIIMQGNFGIFLDLSSLLLVLGGTFGATLINYPIRDIICVFKVVKNAFFYHEEYLGDLIPEMVRFSKLARKDGLLAMEKVLPSIGDQFFFEGMRMVVDGIPPESIRQVLRNEIDFLAARHRVGIGIFQTMGQYSPAFGMIGTLVGLILMLRNLTNAAAIASAMALALITTFYGAMLANIVFLPIAGKLKERSTSEILRKEMILAGVLSIQAGEAPGMVEHRMVSFLPTDYRRIYSQESLL